MIRQESASSLCSPLTAVASSCSPHLRGNSAVPQGSFVLSQPSRTQRREFLHQNPSAEVPRNRPLISDWTLTDMLLNVRGGLRKQDSKTGLVMPSALNTEHNAELLGSETWETSFFLTSWILLDIKGQSCPTAPSQKLLLKGASDSGVSKCQEG